MKLGVVIEESWAFFTEIYAELADHHRTTLFERHSSPLPVFRQRHDRYLAHQDLRRFLAANDVVFFEWAGERLVQASHLPRRAALVTRLHRYELYRWADAILWDAVDRVILVSEAKRREFCHRFPAQAGKVAVIPESISLDRYRLGERPFGGQLGILCHLSPRKRVYELILALRHLFTRRSTFHLHIGGGPHPTFPDYPQALESLVSRLGLEAHVTFHGPVADPTVWYPGIDIFLSNSYSEGLQVAPMEAIASGCYCLSHVWDGADELLPAEDLFVGEEELVAKILGYSDSTEEHRRQQRLRQLDLVRTRFDLARTKVRIREQIEAVADGRVIAR
jgi:glycosyltransferase involved in cell wall biosynthesis